MRPTLMLLALPLLAAGCNLFRSALIERTCEDLPGGCDGIDSEPPDDTWDSGPWIPENPWTLGMVLLSIQDDELWLRAMDPVGEMWAEFRTASDAALRPGPVEYDPATNRLFFWDNAAQVLWVVADGVPATYGPVLTEDQVVGEMYDATFFEGALYLVSDTALWRFSEGTGLVEAMALGDPFQLLTSVFPAFVDNLYLLDQGGDGQPDLHRVTVSTVTDRLANEDFDETSGRAHRGFLGPENKPHVCSDVGAVYAIETLQTGDNAPLAFPDQDELAALFGGAELALETSDCAWDEGAQRFLVHSRALGVLAVDTWGHVEPRAVPASGEAFIRGSFSTPLVDDGS